MLSAYVEWALGLDGNGVANALLASIMSDMTQRDTACIVCVCLKERALDALLPCWLVDEGRRVGKGCSSMDEVKVSGVQQLLKIASRARAWLWKWNVVAHTSWRLYRVRSSSWMCWWQGSLPGKGITISTQQSHGGYDSICNYLLPYGAILSHLRMSDIPALSDTGKGQGCCHLSVPTIPEV